MTVVGVAPCGFQGTIVTLVMDVFVPVMMQADLDRTTRLYPENGRRPSPFLWAFGRPKPNVTLASARAQTEVVGQQLAGNDAIDDIRLRATVLPLWQSPFGAQTYMLPAVAAGSHGTVAAPDRLRERGEPRPDPRRLAARRGRRQARLGASEFRILRLLFVENLVLAVPGAMAGVTMAALGLPSV